MTYNLILPLPPTDNRIHITTKTGRKIKSEAYRQWCTYVELSELRQFKIKNKFKILEPSYENQLEIKAKIYLKDKRSDMTNYIKALKDVMTDIIYTDDKWVVINIQLPALIDKDKPRVELSF